MAEAYTNVEAKRRGVDVVAESAGTVAGKELNRVAVDVMFGHGIDMSGQNPKLLSQSMVDNADQIITMGCGVEADACPSRFVATEDWGLDDPAGKGEESVEAIFAQIRLKVDELLDAIEND